MLTMTVRRWRLTKDPQAELTTPTRTLANGVGSGQMFIPLQRVPGIQGGGHPGQDVLSGAGKVDRASPWTFWQLIQ